MTVVIVDRREDLPPVVRVSRRDVPKVARPRLPKIVAVDVAPTFVALQREVTGAFIRGVVSRLSSVVALEVIA